MRLFAADPLAADPQFAEAVLMHIRESIAPMESILASLCCRLRGPSPLELDPGSRLARLQGESGISIPSARKTRDISPATSLARSADAGD